MTIVDFITELFCKVDDAMKDVPHHSAASPDAERTGYHRAVKGVNGRYF